MLCYVFFFDNDLWSVISNAFWVLHFSFYIAPHASIPVVVPCEVLASNKPKPKCSFYSQGFDVY